MANGTRGRAPGIPNNPNMARSAMAPGLRMTYKRALKIERIARLSLDPRGYNIAQIANALKIHQSTVSAIRMTPEYHAKIVELQTGVVSAFDHDLRSSVDNARAEVKAMLPQALNVIKMAAMGHLGKSLQFKAAQEILDREGNLAKVSKTSVQLENAPNMDVDPFVAGNLLALFNSAPPTNQDSFTINAGVSAALAPEVESPQELLDRLDSEAATKN